jgi:hypothetical protein
LCFWLRSRQHQAEHLLERNLLTATRQRDLGDWQAEALTSSARTAIFTIALLYGPPPQIIHVGLGNCSNARFFDFLAAHWDDLERALTSGSRLVALTLNKIEVFA